MDELVFVTVAAVDDIRPGEIQHVEVGDEPVGLINLDGDFFAMEDACTHEGAPLSDGMIIGDEIECPLHGGALDIRTGAPAALPVVGPARTFLVRVMDDKVQVAAGV